MKKNTLLFLLAFSFFKITAQVSSYTFSQSTGTYTRIEQGTDLGITKNEDERFVDPAKSRGGTEETGPGFPIGFDFTFNGIVFDRVGVSTNGWISLGQSSLTPSVNMGTTSSTALYSVLSSSYVSTPTYLRNRIAGFHSDLSGVANPTIPSLNSNLKIATIGTAPNRSLVVQWSNYKFYGYTTGCNFNFQIILHETSNVVEIVYGAMQFTYASSSVVVGLGGNDNSDFNTRSTARVNNWNSTVSGESNSSTCSTNQVITVPVSGTKFIWTPPSLSTHTFDQSGLNVYPNPVINILNLKYNDTIDNIKIYNLLGEEILSKNINSDTSQVDLSQILSGIYIAKISIKNNIQTLKIIKK